MKPEQLFYLSASRVTRRNSMFLAPKHEVEDDDFSKEFLKSYAKRRKKQIKDELDITMSTVKKGWRPLHTIFGGFGLLNFPTEQLICRLNASAPALSRSTKT